MPRLLWTDDDGRRRFVYEIDLLGDHGWEVHWAESIDDAAGMLRDETWDALIIDQMLPFRRGRKPSLTELPNVWGGCVLLWWLRRSTVPPSKLSGSGIEDEPFFGLAPEESNRDIPVVVVSAFHDEEVAEAIGACSPADSAREIIAKPISEEQLLEALGIRE